MQTIASRSVGEPTGVMVEAGGLQFNLVAIDAGDYIKLMGFLMAFQNANAERDKATLEPDPGKRAALIRAAGAEIGEQTACLLDIAKHALLRSKCGERGVRLRDLSDDDQQAFDDWFGALDFNFTVKQVVPKIMEASGFGTRERPPARAEASP